MDDTAADDALLAQLRSALDGHDPVPEPVADAARSAYAWRTIDAELASLAYDSLLDDKELAGVRSADSATRMLTFESADVTVELAVERGRIIGQLVPAQAGTVELRHAGGLMSAVADEVGRFSFDGVQRGPFSLRCTTADAATIVTAWIVL
ncbi:MAG: hypothetical protein QOG49_1306 [Frankiaceae bacterium]|jgi:hypothetical protein|nr:hypothetical protein [Frankiaceae bacterium]